MAYILTTGVLAKNIKTEAAVAEFVNFSNASTRVRFRVIDWTFRKPRIITSFPIRVRANRGESALAFLSPRVARYEVELTVLGPLKKPGTEFVINCFGRRGRREQIIVPLNSRLFEGNTVLHKNLIVKG